MRHCRSLWCVSALFSMLACGKDPQSASRTFGHNPFNPPPGKLCQASDPSFDGFRYSEHIAHCQRQVPPELKDAVARKYGVPVSDFHLYEFDHFIPLNAGGANDIENLWPEILDEAHQKDQLELEIFNGLSSGTLKQAAAIAEIRAWKPSQVSQR